MWAPPTIGYAERLLLTADVGPLLWRWGLERSCLGIAQSLFPTLSGSVVWQRGVEEAVCWALTTCLLWCPQVFGPFPLLWVQVASPSITVPWGEAAIRYIQQPPDSWGCPPTHGRLWLEPLLQPKDLNLLFMWPRPMLETISWEMETCKPCHAWRAPNVPQWGQGADWYLFSRVSLPCGLCFKGSEKKWRHLWSCPLLKVGMLVGF